MTGRTKFQHLMGGAVACRVDKSALTEAQDLARWTAAQNATIPNIRSHCK